jgi:hypothetical protein
MQCEMVRFCGVGWGKAQPAGAKPPHKGWALTQLSIGLTALLWCVLQRCLNVCTRPSTLQIENRVVLRFQRFGRKKSPFYR